MATFSYRKKRIIFLFLTLLITGSCFSQNTGGYLFAHMMQDDYARLYYSVSRDGLNWKLINNGNRIRNDYRGHPDICVGPYGYYFMIVVADTPPSPRLIKIWRTTDFINWTDFKIIPNAVFENIGDHAPDLSYYGAPKMFYDQESGHFIITWHAPEKGLNQTDHPIAYWQSMRTYYTLTTDLVNFSKPERLFHFSEDFPTIDVIIRKENNKYFAILKDVRWKTEKDGFPASPYGKTVRISSSDNLTGPYTDPGKSVTPYLHEAPMLVHKPDNSGWYLYAEHYPAIGYNISESDSLGSDSWEFIPDSFCSFPAGVRHGSVVQLNERQYNYVESTFSEVSGIENYPDKSLKLYCNGKILLDDIPSETILKIYDLGGRQMSEYNVDNCDLAVTTLLDGFYIAVYQTQDQLLINTKIIIF